MKVRKLPLVGSHFLNPSYNKESGSKLNHASAESEIRRVGCAFSTSSWEIWSALL
jgi:hypothetical protein